MGHMVTQRKRVFSQSPHTPYLTHVVRLEV